MDVSGHSHAPAALPPAPIGREAGGPQGRSEHGGEEKNPIVPAGNWTPVISILTEPPRLCHRVSTVSTVRTCPRIHTHTHRVREQVSKHEPVSFGTLEVINIVTPRYLHLHTWSEHVTVDRKNDIVSYINNNNNN